MNLRLLVISSVFIHLLARCALAQVTVRTAETLVCPNTPVTLQCPAGSSIFITWAEYGFFDSYASCNITQNYANGAEACVNANATGHLSYLCNDKQICDVDADNHEVNRVFGEPCPGVQVPKFMDVHYTCEAYPRVVVCAADSVELSCPGDERLRIVSAVYGSFRDSPDTCNGAAYGIGCDVDALPYVNDQCRGRTRCTLHNNNTALNSTFEFEDLCESVPKHFEVTFTCTADICMQYAGIASPDGSMCCPYSCGFCGGEGCAVRGEGCCLSAISSSEVLCDDQTTAPCAITPEFIHQGEVCIGFQNDGSAYPRSRFISNFDGPVSSLRLKHVAGTGANYVSNWGCSFNCTEEAIGIYIREVGQDSDILFPDDSQIVPYVDNDLFYTMEGFTGMSTELFFASPLGELREFRVGTEYEVIYLNDDAAGAAINDTSCADVYLRKPDQCAPYGGIVGADSAVCCPASCGLCGGTNCGDLPGGASNCCQSSIRANADVCSDDTAAPCYLSGSPPPVTCDGARADDTCCSTRFPCALHGGDCDFDNECEGDLVCGADNCNSIGLGFPGEAWDCCVAPVSVSTAETLVCPNTPVTLQCPAGSSISITWAEYGFFDSYAACGISSVYAAHVETCVSVDAHGFLSTLCNDKETCVVDAANHALVPFLGDLCPQVPKFMDVHYACEASVSREDFVLLSRHRDASLGFFSPDVLSTGVENPLRSSANTYSIIGDVDPALFLIDEERYELELVYTYSDQTQDILRWSQESWITEDAVIGADLSAINDAFATNLVSSFNGLARSSLSNSYLDGTPGNNNGWFHAVAAVSAYNGGIPGHNQKTAYHSELWARKAITSPTPTAIPSPTPTGVPSPTPTGIPSATPTGIPSPMPTELPSPVPTNLPSIIPTYLPSPSPTSEGPSVAIASLAGGDSRWSSAQIAGVVIGGLAGLSLYTLLLVERKRLRRWLSMCCVGCCCIRRRGRSHSAKSKQAADLREDSDGEKHDVELVSHPAGSESHSLVASTSPSNGVTDSAVVIGVDDSEHRDDSPTVDKNAKTKAKTKARAKTKANSSSVASRHSSRNRSGGEGGIVVAGSISASRRRRGSLEGVESLPGRSRTQKQSRSKHSQAHRGSNLEGVKHEDDEFISGEEDSASDFFSDESESESSLLESEPESELEPEPELESESEPDTDSEQPVKATPKPKRHQCSECGIQFKSMSNLSTHKREKHRGVEGFHCGVCNKRFTRKYNLQVHERTHKEDVKRLPWECGICGDGFSQRSNLKRHFFVRHEKPGACSICSTRFKDEEAYLEHFAEAHLGKKARKLKVRQKYLSCGRCSKRFDSLVHLRRHEAASDCTEAVAAAHAALASSASGGGMLEPMKAEREMPTTTTEEKRGPTPVFTRPDVDGDANRVKTEHAVNRALPALVGNHDDNSRPQTLSPEGGAQHPSAQYLSLSHGTHLESKPTPPRAVVYQNDHLGQMPTVPPPGYTEPSTTPGPGLSPGPHIEAHITQSERKLLDAMRHLLVQDHLMNPALTNTVAAQKSLLQAAPVSARLSADSLPPNEQVPIGSSSVPNGLPPNGLPPAGLPPNGLPLASVALSGDPLLHALLSSMSAPSLASASSLSPVRPLASATSLSPVRPLVSATSQNQVLAAAPSSSPAQAVFPELDVLSITTAPLVPPGPESLLTSTKNSNFANITSFHTQRAPALGELEAGVAHGTLPNVPGPTHVDNTDHAQRTRAVMLGDQWKASAGIQGGYTSGAITSSSQGALDLESPFPHNGLPSAAALPDTLSVQHAAAPQGDSGAPHAALSLDPTSPCATLSLTDPINTDQGDRFDRTGSSAQMGTSQVADDADSAPAIGRMSSGLLGNHVDGVTSAYLDQSLDTAMSVANHTFGAFESGENASQSQLRSDSFDLSHDFSRDFLRRSSDSLRESR